MTDEEYDYVVVGSGAGGGPVAANLARAGMSVLLLEAGGDDENFNYQVPSFHGLATEDEALRWDFFVRHYADDEQQRRDPKYYIQYDGVLYPRAGTLGGCTAHNAMITIYPHDADWDAIADLTGDPSWKAMNMRRYFERLERCSYIDRPRPLPRNRQLAWIASRIPSWRSGSGHGWDGWLGTTLPGPELALRARDLQLGKVLLAAAKTSLVDLLHRPLRKFEDFDSLRDPNDRRVGKKGLLGVWSVPLAVSNGRRNGTRELVKAVAAERPEKLTIRLHSLATRVLLDDDGRATGVSYLEGPHLYRADPRASATAASGVERSVRARREVILAGGAFNTPQLLMLSGIGPREELERWNIPVRVELPGVGANLQDRYEVGVIYSMDDNFAVLGPCTFAAPLDEAEPDPCFDEWLQGKGVYTTNGVTLAVIRKSAEEVDAPDLIVFGVPSWFEGYYRNYSRDLERGKNFFTWAILKSHTKNTGGTVRLRSADPRDPPRVNFHYFEEGTDETGSDLEGMVTAVKFVRSMMGRLDAVNKEELPGPAVETDEQIRDFIRDQAWGHHATCTCKIGRRDDPQAVLDSEFRVHGTQGLRVVDASAFPAIPGFFVVTSIYMLAEKASDVILEGRTP